MKIELDFDNKIITVVSEVNMKDLYDNMKELIDKMEEHNLDPKEWKLQHNSITWSPTPEIYPVTVPYNPGQPFYNDEIFVTCNTN